MLARYTQRSEAPCLQLLVKTAPNFKMIKIIGYLFYSRNVIVNAHIQRCHYHYSILVRHPYLLIHIGRFKVAELAVYAYVTRLVKDDEE